MNHPKKQENIDISTNHTTDQHTCLSVSTMTLHLHPPPLTLHPSTEGHTFYQNVMLYSKSMH